MLPGTQRNINKIITTVAGKCSQTYGLDDF